MLECYSLTIKQIDILIYKMVLFYVAITYEGITLLDLSYFITYIM